jgi:hypothetical protein
MKQATIHKTNLLLGAIAAAILLTGALAATLSGELSVELAGVAMSLQHAEEGRLRLFFVRAT